MLNVRYNIGFLDTPFFLKELKRLLGVAVHTRSGRFTGTQAVSKHKTEQSTKMLRDAILQMKSSLTVSTQGTDNTLLLSSAILWQTKYEQMRAFCSQTRYLGQHMEVVVGHS